MGHFTSVRGFSSSYLPGGGAATGCIRLLLLPLEPAGSVCTSADSVEPKNECLIA